MKPDDIPQGVWDAACKIELAMPARLRGCIGDIPNLVVVNPIARAIMAEREACAVTVETHPPLVASGRVLRAANQSDYATAIRSRP